VEVCLACPKSEVKNTEIMKFNRDIFGHEAVPYKVQAVEALLI